MLDGFRASAYSFQQLTTALSPLLRQAPGGGAVVGLTVDSTRALPGYGWMGVYKSALEAVCRYLAMHLGPTGIRVNLVAAGPVETVSARGVRTFSALADQYEQWAPLGWDRATRPGWWGRCCSCCRTCPGTPPGRWCTPTGACTPCSAASRLQLRRHRRHQTPPADTHCGEGLCVSSSRARPSHSWVSSTSRRRSTRAPGVDARVADRRDQPHPRRCHAGHVQHTIRALRDLGTAITVEDDAFVVRGGRYRPVRPEISVGSSAPRSTS